MIAILTGLLLSSALPARAVETDSDDHGFTKVLHPVLRDHCVACHGEGDTAEGDVHLDDIRTARELISRPELIGRLIEVIDLRLMPPDDADSLTVSTRQALLSTLRTLMREAITGMSRFTRTPAHRMNRLQYSSAVQDLFDLKVQVFALPERMLREHGAYFQPQSGKMPPQVQVGSRPLGKSQMIEPRLGGVAAFPQDLRAEHGFDNRGDHLTLSPLLLESFLRLGRSIVESPDFNERTCGIWNELFLPPEAGDVTPAVLQQRLKPFLRRAFRGTPDDSTLDRYVTFARNRLARGDSFQQAMKDVAAATIASPQFFYLYSRAAGNGRSRLSDLDLATRLSFFLWSSIPDDRLLDAAEAGRLNDPAVLEEQVARLLRDRRVKRFCDSFASQWLQLERIISSTPDPDRFPQFYFSKYRASMHMMLEPLLLFETVLIENRSILEFIDSDYSYRSELLKNWYRDGSGRNPGPPTVIRFERVPVPDRRQGGVITTAAVLTMTSGTTRTKPITRGAWLASVILNNPPPPPPADVPPLADEPDGDETEMTLRERFAVHRDHAACAGCHQRIDPLGFALENFDAAGIWRDRYDNGRPVDASGVLFGQHEFRDVVEFKDALLAGKERFVRAFAAHLLSYATGRETGIEDWLTLDAVVQQAAREEDSMHSVIRAVVLSDSFRR